MTLPKEKPFKAKESPKEKQSQGISNGLKVPENYEQFFVPAIGRPLAEHLVNQAAPDKGEQVLDVACGTGIIARLVLDKVGDTGSVTGLDVNPGMLAVARSLTPVDKSIQWCEASAEKMPLSDEAFDLAICQMGLQFMEHKLSALKEMRRVLKPGGRLFFNVPGPAGELFAAFEDAMKNAMGPEAAGFVNQVFSLNDIGEIQGLMKDAGFRDVSVEAQQKTLSLPAPKEFLWQYVNSTPLFGILSKADEETRKAFERAVVSRWKEYVENGTMQYQQRIVTANGRK